MQQIREFVNTYIWRMPNIIWTDIVEIAIISFLVYNILVWIKNTKAWSLLKGVVVIGVFLVVAAIFKMNTILWIAENAVSIIATAIIVILEYHFHPDSFGCRKDGNRDFFRPDHQRNCQGVCGNGKSKDGCPDCH